MVEMKVQRRPLIWEVCPSNFAQWVHSPLPRTCASSIPASTLSASVRGSQSLYKNMVGLETYWAPLSPCDPETDSSSLASKPPQSLCEGQSH